MAATILNPPCTLLRTSGTDIVNAAGEKVVLKGSALGGMLNMENFITGYAGHEFEHRAALANVLGKEKADYFFSRIIHHFFTDVDASLFASLGLNCMRVPFNYRHFIDDLNPGVIKESGFEILDHIVEICAQKNIYVVLDLHAVPGGQNQDWHSDSGLSRALFWEFRDFQDRVVDLWVAIAKRYAGNPVIAGYNPLNEPADPEHTRLLDFYIRLEKEIRAVDPHHILFLDGNTYAMDFSRFPVDRPLPNSVYACHDYSSMGFPTGQPYVGTPEQKAKLRHSFERKMKFMKEAGVPCWNGEFGPVYADPCQDPNAEQTNNQRIALLEEQLQVYREADGVSWSIWVWKDVGYQGMQYLDPNSAYMKLTRPFIEKKQRLGLDFWGNVNKDGVKDVYEPFLEALKSMVPDHLQKRKYPNVWTFERQFERVIRECLLSEYLGWELAELYEGKSFEELEELAASFRSEKCITRERLNNVLKIDANRKD
ncbi:glucan 1,3-beta-glucosidase [Thozetella sp. PMI_491]|nr:glucan 1,3-beta-glucosidase [Thozetella sp. PMI_491]